MNFKNNLDQTIQLYFIYIKDGKEKKRGAGKKEGNRYLSEVKPKSTIELDKTGVEDNFSLMAEMEKVPVKQGYRGVKFNPGSSLGTVMSFQAFQRGHEYKVLAQYSLMVEEPLPGDEDEDPEVNYPTPPDTEEPGP